MTTPQEACILKAADTLLREARQQAAQKRRAADERRAAAAREWERRRAAAAQEQQAQRVTQVQERKARNRAREQVQSITGRLRRETLSAQQQKHLVEELVLAAKEAGDHLSEAEQHKVNEWGKRITALEEPDTTEKTSPAAQPLRDAITGPVRLPDRLVPAVAAVRGALKKAARTRTATSWNRLEQQLGSALPTLTSNERVQVLVQVDRSTAGDEPLLSSLLAAGDPHFAYQYYRHVLTALGLDAPDNDEDLRDVVEADAEQVFTDWRFR
ncbi:hypothetical protein [Streptomyces sp. RT42]|uniref:hypothetical protein n=1 Tax=Streptomyces sp. RT42 TaxID=2824898 RepID=UPI001B386C08|nr:hypothetical protein [Streptomyces sp. RT42]MBQ0877523.1 hypothetical protein [Streptomyces sp. RT42]